MSRLVSIIGDANIRRNMTGLNIASRDAMKTSQVLACDDLNSLDGALSQVRSESTVCIIAAVTDMLLAADDTGTISSSIESVLRTFKSKIIPLCVARPNLLVAVVPPLYRNRPFWYQKNLPQISGLFSAILTNDHPANFRLLPSFCSQETLPDGVYLTPVSGLHYVLHVFDQAEVLVESLTRTSDAQMYHVQELGRQHDDRIVFLEQRHGHLDERFDLKVARDAEFNDYMLNRAEEDFVTIIGSKRIPGETPREWQIAAKRQMNEIFKLILKSNRVHLDYTVVYVGNPLRYRKQGKTVYNVRLNSAEVARRFRDLFSGYFRHHSPLPLPAILKGVSLRNKITLETRVRISIMHQLGAQFVESNGPGSSYKVKGFDSRPLLQTFPPSGASGSRPQTFTFVEAATQLPGVFTDDGLVSIHQKIGTRHQGQLQAIFIVLRDDDRGRIDQLIRQQPRDRGQPRPGVSVTTSGNVADHGSGMDVQSANLSTLGALRLPPPPPPPLPAAKTGGAVAKESPVVPCSEQKRRRSSSSSTSDERSKRPRKSSSDSPKRTKSKKSSSTRSHHRSRGSRKSRRRSPSSSSASGSSDSSDSSAYEARRSSASSRER